jgi:hypothetical protein
MNPKSKETFDENNQNKSISIIRDCKNDFSARLGSLGGKLNFESGYKL